MVEILHYETLDSTNEEAKRLLHAGRIDGPTLIRADSQTAGKGTRGRTWISPPGAGLYLSIVHPLAELPDRNFALSPLFTLAAGVACAEALHELTGLVVQLKPVNDLYADGRKLGGILTESMVSGSQCRAVITGIGVNIRDHENVHRGCRDDARGNTPTSLQACIPPAIFNQWQLQSVTDELCHALLDAVDARYRMLLSGETEAILTAYRNSILPGHALPPELVGLADSAPV